MKSYTKIIPGKKTDACTVHCHEQTDPAAAYGHYLLSQGKGPRNPDFNSNYLVTQLVEALAGRQSGPLDMLGEESRKTITGVQATLRGQDNFTLDSVIIKEKQCRIQQVSKAQEEAQIYFVHDDGNVELVTASKGGQSSSETSPSINEYERSLEGVRYIFLAVGGLTSRVTPGQISTLLSSMTDYEALFVLDKFARLIQTPKEKVRELRKEALYDILKEKEESLPPEKEALVELIFKWYGHDQEVTAKVDEAAPLRDTGLMLIDVEDRTSALVAQGQASFKASVESIEQLAQEVGAFRARYEEAERRGGEFKKLLQQRDEAVKQWEKQYQELRMEGMKEKALLEGQLKAKERELGPLAERLDRKNKEHDRERESWNREKVELKEREQQMFAEREHWPRDFTDRYERAQRELAQIVENLGISSRPAGINDEQRKALATSKETIKKYEAATSGAPSSPATTNEDPAKAEGAPRRRSWLEKLVGGTLLLTGIVGIAGIALGSGYLAFKFYTENNVPRIDPINVANVSSRTKNEPAPTPVLLNAGVEQKTSPPSTAAALPSRPYHSSTSEKYRQEESKEERLSITITEFSCRQVKPEGGQALCRAELNDQAGLDKPDIGTTCKWTNPSYSSNGPIVDEIQLWGTNGPENNFRVFINPQEEGQSIMLTCQRDGYQPASASTKVELALKSPFGKGQANVPRAPALKTPSPPRRGARSASSATTGSDRTRP